MRNLGSKRRKNKNYHLCGGSLVKGCGGGGGGGLRLRERERAVQPPQTVGSIAFHRFSLSLSLSFSAFPVSETSVTSGPPWDILHFAHPRSAFSSIFQAKLRVFPEIWLFLLNG
ncbi:hypothetical protein SLE2022_099630 [Rubroshorea leprosula]